MTLTDVQSTADAAVTGGRFAGPIAKAMLDYLLTGPGSHGPAAEAGTAPVVDTTPPAHAGRRIRDTSTTAVPSSHTNPGGG